MTSRPSRPSTVLLACLTVASLVTVAGCSSDKADSGSSGTATTTAATTGASGEAGATTTMAGGGTATTAAGATATTAAGALPDIVGTALGAVQFTTLAGLVVDAGLVDTLRGQGPFTVFAPTDAAFAAVPTATLRAVQADPALLKTVLTYHVVPGKLAVADLQPGKLKTVAGINLDVTRQGDKVFVNGIEVVKGDIEAANGMVHVINGVLVPPTS